MFAAVGVPPASKVRISNRLGLVQRVRALAKLCKRLEACYRNTAEKTTGLDATCQGREGPDDELVARN
jgi:hypothetical protein